MASHYHHPLRNVRAKISPQHPPAPLAKPPSASQPHIPCLQAYIPTLTRRAGPHLVPLPRAMQDTRAQPHFFRLVSYMMSGRTFFAVLALERVLAEPTGSPSWCRTPRREPTATWGDVWAQGWPHVWVSKPGPLRPRPRPDMHGFAHHSEGPAPSPGTATGLPRGRLHRPCPRQSRTSKKKPLRPAGVLLPTATKSPHAHILPMTNLFLLPCPARFRASPLRFPRL